MKKLIAALAIAGVSGFGASTIHTAPADAAPLKKKIVIVKPAPNYSNRNRNIAIGAAAVVGTIIAVEAARASSGGGGGELSCRALERRCDDGQNWACRRLDVREDC